MTYTTAKAGHPLHVLSPTNADWGVGGGGVIENPSPFPRVNALRQQYFSTEYTVNAERAVLATEAYQKYEHEPQQLKVAQVFAHILKHCTIDIDDLELIVGNCAAPSKACPVFPEFSYEWIAEELRNAPFRDRAHDRYAHSPETDELLLGMEDYWQGRTVADHIFRMLSEDELKGTSFGGLGVFALDVCTQGGVGHVIPHYERVYKYGWLGLKQQVQEKLADLDLTQPANLKKRMFYQSQLIVIEATIQFCKRYGALAGEHAKSAEGERHDELLQIADHCEWISEHPPRTFREALQLGFFVINNALIESNGHSVSFGRFDQLLYPFYQRDIAAGIITQAGVQELIESAIIKFYGYMKLRDWQTTSGNSGRGIGGLTLTIGGVDSDGRDVTNALSYMCLDALAHTQMSQPWVIARIHENTPDLFLTKVAQVIKIGMGEPKVVNDRVIIPSMLARGRTLSDARDYSIVGLIEPDVAGREYSWHDGAYLNIARVLELTLNDGYPLGNSSIGQIGLATGSLADFTSFEAFQNAFEQQMNYWVERMVQGVNIIDLVHQDQKPLPYLSLLVEDCIEKGVDVSAGGALYNFTGVQAVGMATVADSLAAIKQLVFDEKKVTGQDLLEALNADWVGFEYLYALVNSRKVNHYGNDNSDADMLARYTAGVWCRAVAGRPNAHGGVFQPGIFSVSVNIPFGAGQWATPDGRKAGEPLSDGISPVHTSFGSHDVKGITAVIKSATQLDQEAASNGVLFNLKISPSTLQSENANANLISLIKTYFRHGGMHLQVSVLNRETLEDADRHPEKYKGLLVYVAGYSTLWSELGESLKKDIISRTELAFDNNSDLTPPD